MYMIFDICVKIQTVLIVLKHERVPRYTLYVSFGVCTQLSIYQPNRMADVVSTFG